MNLLLDDDGQAYVFYASEDNATLYVSRLNADFTDIERPAVEGKTWRRNFPGAFREAPAPFKHAGRYYLITSGCTGWNPNAADLAIADHPLGPYVSQGNPCVGPHADKTFGAQSTFVLPLPNQPGHFVFLADRWNPKDLRDSRYAWLPFNIVPDQPVRIEWRDSWSPSLPTAGPASGAQAQANRRVVERYFDEWANRGNTQAVDQLVAPHLVLRHPHATVNGLDQYKHSMAAFRSAFPDLHFVVEDLVAENDRVLARYVMTGTQQGDYQEHPASGRACRVAGMSLFRLHDGLIQEVWVNQDRLGMQQQLGWLPSQPGSPPPAATVLTNAPGHDWSLPNSVRETPNAGWEPDSGYLGALEAFLGALAERYAKHPRFTYVDIRCIEHIYGEGQL